VKRWVARSLAATLASLWTALWLLFLYAYTWVACFGTHPFCHDGVRAQLILTAIYGVGMAAGARIVRHFRRREISRVP